MLTPRSTLSRRIAAALDATPSRIPVLLGDCGSGRTTLLHQLRERIGRSSSQYLDIEHTATTPEPTHVDRSNLGTMARHQEEDPKHPSPEHSTYSKRRMQ